MESATHANIRAAASLIAARAARTGVEVLVVRRSARSTFLPGYLVFPGGAVEARDQALAARWFGAEAEAPRATAVRELGEEAGLAATSAGVRAAEGADPLALVDAAPPRPRDLPEISRWVAPGTVPVRFDARFFAAAASARDRPTADDVEAEAVAWERPADIIERWAAGECLLYWPTMKLMEALARCSSVDELLALHVPQQEPDPDDEARLPRSTFVQDA
jgi:8-oxo-dGTP pyrophosphatase MutT (NUDIX family)